MWNRFTEPSRRVVFFAQEEAARLGENSVGTEHLLLGLTRDNDTVAVRILERLGTSSKLIRAELEKQVTRGPGNLGQDMQLTPGGRRVIEFADEERTSTHDNYIGTEHLLLGVIREEEELGGRVLRGAGVSLERARAVMLQMQEGLGP
jgi:ATP-dependent Clp protease ATP-binding subunit ClpC